MQSILYDNTNIAVYANNTNIAVYSMIILILFYLLTTAGGQGSVNVPDGENDDIDQILREIEATSVSGGRKAKTTNTALAAKPKPKAAAAVTKATAASSAAPPKKKGGKKQVQTDPPSVPIVDLFPDGEIIIFM